MTRTEMMLVNRVNQLTMMVFLQEMRAQVLAQQVREANAVIEGSTRAMQELTETMLGAIEAYDGEGTRIC